MSARWLAWFAWHPVRLGNWREGFTGWTWLRTVERIERCGGCSLYGDCWYEYRAALTAVGVTP